jgi:hypothetical protein
VVRCYYVKTLCGCMDICTIVHLCICLRLIAYVVKLIHVAVMFYHMLSHQAVDFFYFSYDDAITCI